MRKDEPSAKRLSLAPQLVQQDPALIQPLLQQLGANNPQLAQLINQNPEALYQLLAGADDEEGDFDPAAFGGAEGEDPFAGQTVIQLTEQEAEAVRRVSAPNSQALPRN